AIDHELVLVRLDAMSRRRIARDHVLLVELDVHRPFERLEAAVAHESDGVEVQRGGDQDASFAADETDRPGDRLLEPDLRHGHALPVRLVAPRVADGLLGEGGDVDQHGLSSYIAYDSAPRRAQGGLQWRETGRASCRERM